MKKAVKPTNDSQLLMQQIIQIQASAQTNLAASLREAIQLLTDEETTKHIILITDALPTVGSNPEKDTLTATAEAHDRNISISVVGIGLSDKGKRLAEQIVEIGRGRIFIIKDVENIDMTVLEDYYQVE